MEGGLWLKKPWASLHQEETKAMDQMAKRLEGDQREKGLKLPLR